ncbi:MAG: localization factor PodJL, partial [Rhodospirillaceae bacterium]
MPSRPLDWAGMPVGELRDRADAGSIAAMEELARRLVQGIGMPKDPQVGAGWLMRAAQSGSAQSAFNVAVMYERGFMLERNFARAIEWYRRAVEADLAIAKHNLALMLREGKGTARNGKEAIELLQSAARQGMAASMFSLGEIYERGDAVPKDLPMAMAWFAIAAEFERQANRGAETALAKTSATRAQALQHNLTQQDLQRAEQIGQDEFRRIVEAMQRPARPQVRLAPLPPAEVATAIPAPAPPRTGALAPLPPPDLNPPDWPKSSTDQVRMIQKALFDLKLLRDKPDGALGPMTRAAIRTFQRINAQRETGEPTKELYASLKEAVARRDVAPPARPETRPEPPVAVASARPPEARAAKVVPPKAIVIAAAETTPPPSSDDITRLMPTPPKPPKPIELAAAETTPPPSSDDITRLMPTPLEPPKPIELAAAETTPPPSS